MIANPLAELHVPSGDDWIAEVRPLDRKRKAFRVGVSAKATEDEAYWTVNELLKRRGIGVCDVVLRRKWQVVKTKIQTPRAFLERYL